MTASFIQIQTVDPITLTPVGQFRLNSTLSLPTPTFAERILTIASTDTTVPLPLGATVMVITPPANCTSVLLLKGAAGDTGFTLNTSNPSCISVPAGPANVLLNSNPSAIYMFTFM